MARNTPNAQGSSAAKFTRSRKKSWRKWLGALAILVLLALMAGGSWLAYDYNQIRKENERLSNPTEAAKAATERLVTEVGRLVQLPTGEAPTIATVSDAAKLKSQTFFAKAQNGDKVLIYTQAKRAILYRPSTDKVIEIAPVNLGANQTSNTGSSGVQPDQSSQTDQSSQ